MVERGTRRWRWQRRAAGKLAAEFLGTSVIVCFGDGVVAMVVATLNPSGHGAIRRWRPRDVKKQTNRASSEEVVCRP